MQLTDIVRNMEAILFAAGDCVELERICTCLGITEEEGEAAAKALGDSLRFERRGIRLIRVGTALQLCSDPELADTIRRALEKSKPPKLSPTALETLAVIAYYQPTTRSFIETIRGVDSTYSVGLLLDRGLIEEAGTLSVPGRPKLYKTGENFLRTFGISSLSELPELGAGLSEDKPAEDDGQLMIGDLEGEAK
ncbi:MAG: SMC-Scp complex subunit ScpB [Oscillospiraceae bacterium]|jgi:segregation and condensation protein B